jgi:hypothetical protein
MKLWRDSFSASSTLTLADSSSSEECLAVSSESRIEHVMHLEQLSAQNKKRRSGSRTLKSGLKQLDSLSAIFRVFAQSLDLLDLLQHVNAQIFVQFPRGLRSSRELVGY